MEAFLFINQPECLRVKNSKDRSIQWSGYTVTMEIEC